MKIHFSIFLIVFFVFSLSIFTCLIIYPQTLRTIQPRTHQQRGSDELLSQTAVMAPAADNNNQDLATKKAKLDSNSVIGGVGEFFIARHRFLLCFILYIPNIPFVLTILTTMTLSTRLQKRCEGLRRDLQLTEMSLNVKEF
jgi:hypothetical protein